MTDFFEGYPNPDLVIDILHSGKVRDVFFVDNQEEFSIIVTFDDQDPKLLDSFNSKAPAFKLFWQIGDYLKQRGLL